MRSRGVHHVEFCVLDYGNSIAFFDKMFGRRGCKSFWTLDIGYRRLMDALKAVWKQHPEWESPPWKSAGRKLPS